MKSIAEYKKNRQTMLQSLSSELEKVNSKGFQNENDDERFWNVTRDKAGNGTAIIRFLPARPDEDYNFVRYFRHSFQGPTGLWYIENCPTSIGRSCPVCDHNRELWNTGVKANQELVSKHKRRMVLVSNILVIKDPANPENEGKIKLFKYGKKIHDKINDMMNPTFEGDESINPFDFFSGANFKLIVRMVDKFPNYDKSVFEAPSPVSEDEKELEKIWNAQYSLAEFLDEKNFKPDKELKEKLARVLGNSSTPKAVTETATPSVGKTTSSDDEESISFESDDDIDADFFKKMAEA